MTKKLFIILSLPILISSCATLKESNLRQDRTFLTNDNYRLLNGTYKRISVKGDKANLDDLVWVLFVEGQQKGDRVKLELIDNRQLKATVLSESTVETTKIYKGKIQNGQFVLKRKVLLLPLIVANIYRNRNARLCVLDNGDLIVDAKTFLFGLSLMLPIPIFDTEKTYDNIYHKIESDSLQIK
jgi:hypothetical protein